MSQIVTSWVFEKVASMQQQNGLRTIISTRKSRIFSLVINRLSHPFVLVVEDDPLQRLVAVNLVEDAGFKALEAADAEEAIQILELRNDVGVVLTDVDMPGRINGLKLAFAVHNRWPPLAIIIVSGQRPLDEMPVGSVFFSKPYSETEMLAKLREFLQ